ncbi:MAG: ATP synthase F0 subunit B [Spirochaetales bacterium]
MALFQLEPGLFLWTLICFVVVLVILQKWAIPPLLKNLRERQARIADNLAEGQRLALAADTLAADREALLAAARLECATLVQAARDQAAALRITLVEAAQAEVAQLLADGSKRALADRQRALGALQNELATLVCDASEALVEHAFLRDEDREWSRSLVARL